MCYASVCKYIPGLSLISYFDIKSNDYDMKGIVLRDKSPDNYQQHFEPNGMKDLFT